MIAGTYLVMVPCDNCGSDNPVAVPLGTTVKKHLSETSVPCGVCMCLTLDADYVRVVRSG